MNYLSALKELNSIKKMFKEESLEKVGQLLNYPTFDDVVYNEKQKEFMRLIIQKIKNNEKMNLLFAGYAGTGKTFSAKMISVETKRPFVYLNGFFNQASIKKLILNLKDNAIVCIDEIHNLPEKVAEVLYPAIEENMISDNGEMIYLNNILFIGTTTEPEKMPKPLLDRMFRVDFEEPDEETIKEILKKMNVEEEAIKHLIIHTTNIRILKKLISYMDLYGGRNINSLVKVFRMMKINLYDGLSEEQRKYIEILKKGRQSARSLSLTLKRSEEYLKYEIEPDLIRKQIITITSRGRELKDSLVITDKEIEKAEIAMQKKTFTEDSRTRARRYLMEHPEIKDKFAGGGRLFELINFIARKIGEGIEPDLIDFYSFGVDKSITESYRDNYLKREE